MKLDELVVRQIIVQRVDDPIAPQMNPGRGGHAFIGIRITQHIQPMPRITNRVLFVFQKTIDHFLISVGRMVGQEGVLFGGRGWNANQVEINAPQQSGFVRRSNGLEASGALFRADEKVDWIRNARGAGRQ